MKTTFTRGYLLFMASNTGWISDCDLPSRIRAAASPEARASAVAAERPDWPIPVRTTGEFY